MAPNILPYKGGGAAIQALLAQEAHLLFLTSSKRTPVAPGVPTLAEAGLSGFDVNNWHTVFAPRGTPPEAEAWPSTPAEARAHVRAEIVKRGKIVQAAKLQ